ncbi:MULTISPECIES: hypothetical protein [unclassified Bradyrhizobium]|uniref:hypothetical protein n=1 Tax=unclassified Bradyrhizobium TaxID=2631580 RepID=UPI0029161191|nr:MULTISPECIES: hypothetical protein [unclassified Bradyrhizobium]
MRFRVPELFLGCLLTVAVFATSMVFASRPSPQQSVHPVSESRSTLKPTSSADSDPAWSTWLTKDASGFFTAAQAFIGLIQAVLFFVQLRFMRQSLGDTKAAATAARDAATAAKQQVDVAKAQIDVTKIGIFDLERAYIDAGPVELKTQYVNTPGAIVFRPGDPMELVVTVGMKNTGRTRAAITCAHGEFSKNSLGDTPTYNRLIGETYLTDVSLSPGESHDFPFPFRCPDMSDQTFFGYVEYKDIFKNAHKSRFCARLRPSHENGKSGTIQFAGGDAWRECD